MKLVMAARLPNEFAPEFTHLIRDSDARPAGVTIQIMADAALPKDLRSFFQRYDFPVLDPRRFHDPD